mmetsp:Transcript_29052/g.32590  ORF Transcript_29052/g.32590 Transcript_29052/m.32590 type:complete len:1297 (-) Transcript_29052:13-3903(-)
MNVDNDDAGMETSSSLREKAHEEDFERMKQTEFVADKSTGDFAGIQTHHSTGDINNFQSMSELRKMMVHDMTFTAKDDKGCKNDTKNNGNENEFFFFNSPLEWKTNIPLRVPMIYCDFTASHRPLKSIERYIRETCLPYYGNTHTNTSVTGGQSSAFVSESRQIIAEACNAKITGKASLDVVLFAGNGTTGAVRLLIDCLGLKHINNTDDEKNRQKPLIILGPFEHHSNLLPWRELGGDKLIIETAKLTQDGSTVDMIDLERILVNHRKTYSDCPFIIGSFSAASNVTGVIADDIAITKLLHKYGALSFWDYATGASYLNINVNPNPSLILSTDKNNIDNNNTKAADIAKDAIFFSGHKLLGGAGGTPGVLIVKKSLVSTLNSPGQSCGGGTVFYVTKDSHRFLSDRIERYEGGTPNVVGIWRLGLVWKLKLSLKIAAGKILFRNEYIEKNTNETVVDSNHPTSTTSMTTTTTTVTTNITNTTISPSSLSSLLLEYDLKRSKTIQERLKNVPNLVLLDGKFSMDVPKLPIYSFLIRCGKMFLHYNYVCALLNDVFGIQSRGGCQCAGPYSQYLLGMNSNGNDNDNGGCGSNDAVEKWLVHTKDELMRPGATRLSLPSMGTTIEQEDYVVDAIRWVATHGWKLLHVYRCNHRSGEWRHKSRPGAPLGTRGDRRWLSYYRMKNEDINSNTSNIVEEDSLSLVDAINNANKMLLLVVKDQSSISQTLKMVAEEESSSSLRWYVYPKDVARYVIDGLDEVPGTVDPSNILGALQPLALRIGEIEIVTMGASDTATVDIDLSTVANEKETNTLPTKFFFRDGEHSGEAFLEEIIEGRDDGELSDHCQIFDPTFDDWREISFFQKEEIFNNIEGNPIKSDDLTPEEKPTSMEVEPDEDFLSVKNDRKKPQRDVSAWGKGQVQYLHYIPNKDGDEKDRDHTIAPNQRMSKHVKPPPKLMRLCTQAMIQFDMLEDGDRLLIGLSGGKDSMSLLHVLLEFKKKLPIRFEIEVCTIDPLTPSFDPSPLIPYVESLGLKYHYIRDDIVGRAASSGKDGKQVSSLCAFCARMKRGNLYACARKNNCNKLVLAQHLDDLAESFMMSVMHNGFLRTMKANYKINSGDLSVIRPFAYVRESMMTEFAKSANLPVINENCPACFEEPKERARMKKLLSKEETLYPCFYDNIKRAMIPLMHDDATAIMRSYTEEALAKSRKGVKKKPSDLKKKNGGIRNGEFSEPPDNFSRTTALENASEDMLVRELARRRATKFRLAGSMARDSRGNQNDPMGQVCSLNGGNGTIPCSELME